MTDEVEFEIRDGENVVLSFSSEDMTWDEFLAAYGGNLLGEPVWRDRGVGEPIG